MVRHVCLNHLFHTLQGKCVFIIPATYSQIELQLEWIWIMYTCIFLFVFFSSDKVDNFGYTCFQDSESAVKSAYFYTCYCTYVYSRYKKERSQELSYFHINISMIVKHISVSGSFRLILCANIPIRFAVKTSIVINIMKYTVKQSYGFAMVNCKVFFHFQTTLY